MTDSNKNVPKLRFPGFTDDWEQRKLKDVKDIEDRYAYTGGPFGSDLKSSDYTDTGVRIIQLQNIGDGTFLNDYKIFTSEEKAERLQSNLIYPGEIIIAKMADPLARATILPDTEQKYLLASDGIRLKVNTKDFDNYYILTLINSDIFRKEALSNSTGTTRKRIGLVTLGNLSMMIPSFDEQQKIGSLFKQLDTTIALHQRKLSDIQKLKSGLLQKMFPTNGENVPEIRFPEFTNAWEQRKLSELATMNARIGWQNLRTSEFLDNGDYMLITGTDFKDGVINYSNIHYVEKERFEQDKKIQISNGSILITKDGTLGKVAYVEGLTMPATLNAGVFNVRVKEDFSIDSKYLFHYLKAPFLLKFADQQSTGGTIKHLNQNVLVEFPIPLPSLEEQRKIAGLLSSFDNTIILHQRKLEHLQQQKKALLQQMFI